MRQSKTAWTSSICRSAAAIMVTTTCLAIGLDNAVDAGVVVAVAAGNSGPGQAPLSRPAARAKSSRSARAQTSISSASLSHIRRAAEQRSAQRWVTSTACRQRPLILFDTASDGCTSVDPGASGKLAIINRGTCTFSQKVANAKAAGAIAVLIVNNVAGDPIAMARTAGFDDDIPAVMISQNEGAALRASGATTASARRYVPRVHHSANKDILAGFSSQGPTNVDLAVKPDIPRSASTSSARSHALESRAHRSGEAPAGPSSAAPQCRRRTLPAQRPCSCNCIGTGRLRKSSRRSSTAPIWSSRMP